MYSLFGITKVGDRVISDRVSILRAKEQWGAFKEGVNYSGNHSKHEEILEFHEGIVESFELFTRSDITYTSIRSLRMTKLVPESAAHLVQQESNGRQ